MVLWYTKKVHFWQNFKEVLNQLNLHSEVELNVSYMQRLRLQITWVTKYDQYAQIGERLIRK